MLQKHQGQGRYKTIADLKLAANTLNFIQEHDIQDLDDLRKTVGGFYTRQSETTGKLKKVEQRIETLDEHIKQGENRKKYRGYKARYDKLYGEYTTALKSKGFGAKRKAEKALETANNYYENFRAEIVLCEAAQKHLTGVMNGKSTAIPLENWKAEHTKLAGEKNALYREYYTLKDEVSQVEKIRQHIEDIMRVDSRERPPIKAHDMEL
jgi:peptidoglycan hydrolase CwlO-like protein